jgi:small GTP-binding protein
MARRNLIKKICLLGDGAVGKTSLIRKYVYDAFDDKYLATIGAKVTKKVLEFEDENAVQFKCTMMIHDIVGQVEFERIHKQYYRGSEAAILVCDLTRKDTLEHIGWWLESLSEVVDKVPVILLGNKLDLKDQHEVDLPAVEAQAKDIGCPYYLTSAKTGENVENAFQNLGRRVCEK